MVEKKQWQLAQSIANNLLASLTKEAFDRISCWDCVVIFIIRFSIQWKENRHLKNFQWRHLRIIQTQLMVATNIITISLLLPIYFMEIGRSCAMLLLTRKREKKHRTSIKLWCLMEWKQKFSPINSLKIAQKKCTSTIVQNMNNQDSLTITCTEQSAAFEGNARCSETHGVCMYTWFSLWL